VLWGLWEWGKQKGRRVLSLRAGGRQISSPPVGLQRRSRDAGCRDRGLAGNCSAGGSREQGGRAEGRELSGKGCGCRWHLPWGGAGGSRAEELFQPAGLAARATLGRGIAPRFAEPGAVAQQSREGARAGEGNLPFQW